MIYKDTRLPIVDFNLFSRQVDTFSRYIWFEFFGNMVIAASIVLYLFNVMQNSQWLIVWMSFFIAFNVLRLLNGYVFCKKNKQGVEQDAEKSKHWLYRHFGLTLGIGLLWGLAGIWFSAPLLPWEGFIIPAILGIAAVSIITLSASYLLYFLYVTSMSLPVIINLFLQDKLHYHSVAWLMIGVLLLLLLAAYYLFKFLQENHDMRQQFHRQAHTDPLTDLPNRRYFESSYRQEWLRLARDQQPLSLLLVDIDHFKRYNAHFGHQAGDRCLKSIANCVRKVARRAADMPARLGGEEFVLLLPNTQQEDAWGVAERLREMVEGLEIKHPSSATAEVVTVSIGVASCTPTPITPTAGALSPQATQETVEKKTVRYPAMLLASADRAMYCAKEGGRNCISLEDCGHHTLLESKRSHAFDV